ncbi:MAG: DUF4430 domain-containing protein [Candidatus Scalindua sp.]|jgi:hypothetical protein|nr:DUF4430 domain-containing protein [Candidatus Scalindua sp.]
MKTISKISVVFICLTVFCAAVCASEKVKVGIDYGGTRKIRDAETKWTEGVTALEVLESVAQVETHQVKDYIFVTSIDGVKGRRGDKGWYYEINGKRADKLAFRRVLNKDDSTKWIYKKDVCSPKVDK